jgi:rhodanese-related sulfurtransferase
MNLKTGTPRVPSTSAAASSSDIVQTFPKKDTELILYCGGGYRSALATDMLQKMGYTNVWSMAGGWKAWKESGSPVE